MPARVLNSSPARWLALPTPGEEKLSCPGFDLASATRSFTDFTPSAGDTTRMLGTLAMRLTPARSFSVSYGSLVNIAAVTAAARGAEDHASHADQQCAHNPYPSAGPCFTS